MLEFRDVIAEAMQCPVCAVSTTKILADSLRRGEGIVYYCEACDVGFLKNERQVDLKEFYAEEYRKTVAHTAEAAATNAREIFDIYKKFQKSRIEIIHPYINDKTHFLEIGASAGQFLTTITDKCERLCAIEVDKDCAVFLDQEFDIEIDTNFLEDSAFANDQFDIVTAFQVLEHTDDPVSFMKSVHHVTRPGGRVFIEVPNLYDPLLSVWNVPSYQTFYYHGDHLFYFSAKALNCVAERAGFDISSSKVHFTQDYNLLNHLNWIETNAPQSTCEPGLSEISLDGKNQEITNWLEAKLQNLNDDYIEKLATSGLTSNIMIELVKA